MINSAALRFHIDTHSALSPRRQIRQQIISYVYFGFLTPGARLPSVRDLAAQTGLNLKTAFRIYRGLAREKLVEIRPKQGVFIKLSPRTAQQSYQNSLRGFLTAVVHAAQEFNLTPARLAELLTAGAGRLPALTIRCAVLECNREQTDVFSAELQRRLKVDAFPVLTTAAARQRERALRQADVFITTDFHWEEVQRWALRHHKEVYRIRLDPRFLGMLIRYARRGLFPMILTDVSFEPAFRQAIMASVPSEVAARLVFVHYRDRTRLRQVLRQARCAYVSPLCYPELAPQLPRHLRLITVPNIISNESISALRRSLFKTA